MAASRMRHPVWQLARGGRIARNRVVQVLARTELAEPVFKAKTFRCRFSFRVGAWWWGNSTMVMNPPARTRTVPDYATVLSN
jgi:ornithine carbamoyltransferase